MVAKAPRPVRREVLIRAGRVAIRASLLATPTAERIWAGLPIYSTAERWGGSLHFATRVETGRERDARQTVAAGEIAFWSEADRVVIGFGPTPIAGAGQIRLPSPCNIWAIALDDVTGLEPVRAGERVAMLRADA